MGFPTVNIPLTDSSVSGIYAALVRAGVEELRAAVYADQRRKILEAHILDSTVDLYGKAIEIELIDKIREDIPFATEEELKRAIADDVAKVQEYFKKTL